MVPVPRPSSHLITRLRWIAYLNHHPDPSTIPESNPARSWRCLRVQKNLSQGGCSKSTHYAVSGSVPNLFGGDWFPHVQRRPAPTSLCFKKSQKQKQSNNSSRSGVSSTFTQQVGGGPLCFRSREIPISIPFPPSTQPMRECSGLWGVRNPKEAG